MSIQERWHQTGRAGARLICGHHAPSVVEKDQHGWVHHLPSPSAFRLMSESPRIFTPGIHRFEEGMVKQGDRR